MSPLFSPDVKYRCAFNPNTFKKKSNDKDSISPTKWENKIHLSHKGLVGGG